MVSTGLKLVRFRGRYFAFYNHIESYPRVLGRQLVDQIPSTAVKYTEWLEDQRNFYAQMTADLDSKCLIVTDETIRTCNLPQGDYMAWQYLDDRLVELPSPVCESLKERPFEWIYTIDLDRELFSVNTWIHFDLWHIPRDSWTRGFYVDDEGNEEFSFEVCPEATDVQPPCKYFTSSKSRHQYELKYRQYDCSVVSPRADIEKASKMAFSQIIATIVFDEFMRSFALWFNVYVPGWCHDDFGFREFAFAILSFASGKYHFGQLGLLDGHVANGFFTVPLKNKSSDIDISEILPVFVKGCHIPGQAGGSAPQTSMYWFQGVLVSLVPDDAIESEATIAKVVEAGLEQGKLGFFAIALSLIRAVMMQVRVENSIIILERTEAVEISTRSDIQGDDLIVSYCRSRTGFASLVHFFNAASAQFLPDNQGRFPTEIYARILAYTDNATHRACAEVSRVFRSLCQEDVRFGENLLLIKLDAKYHEFTWLRMNWVFTVSDRETEMVVESMKSIVNAQADQFCWSPIIGSERPSLVYNVQLLSSEYQYPQFTYCPYIRHGSIEPLRRPPDSDLMSMDTERINGARSGTPWSAWLKKPGPIT